MKRFIFYSISIIILSLIIFFWRRELNIQKTKLNVIQYKIEVCMKYKAPNYSLPELKKVVYKSIIQCLE